MRELNTHDRLSEKQSIEQTQKKTQTVEFKYDSSLRPLRGHIVWEINVKSGEIKQAEYKKYHTIYWFDALKCLENGWKKEIIKQKGCIYISALTKESALKRWKEGKGSATLPKPKDSFFKI